MSKFTFALQDAAKPPTSPFTLFFYGSMLNMQQPIRMSALISLTNSCTSGAKCQQHEGESPGIRQQCRVTTAQTPYSLNTFVSYKSTWELQTCRQNYKGTRWRIYPAASSSRLPWQTHRGGIRAAILQRCRDSFSPGRRRDCETLMSDNKCYLAIRWQIVRFSV